MGKGKWLVTSQHFLCFPHCLKKISSQSRVVKSLKAKGGTDCGYKSMHQFLTFQHPFLKQALFLPVCCSSLLKTLWKNKKLQVTSSFSFSHSVFYLFNELSAISKNKKHEIVVCKFCRFGRVYNTCRLGKD